MTHFKAEDIDQKAAGKWGMPPFVERLRVRLGASQRQFMVFGLLRAHRWCDDGQTRWHASHGIVFASSVVCREPRLADQDPKIIAAQTGPRFRAGLRGSSDPVGCLPAPRSLRHALASVRPGGDDPR